MLDNIETSLTLDYRAWTWGLDRLALDGISNHLPKDSKGKNAVVLSKKGGRESLFDFNRPERGLEEVIFADDGPGYDYRLLSVLFSTKSKSDGSVGQWGEGLKLVAATALRNGVQLKYMSRDWIATPYRKKIQIDGVDMERLCFEIESGEKIKGSRTLIYSPGEQLTEHIASIGTKVLFFNRGYQSHFSLALPDQEYTSQIITLAPTPHVKKQALFVKNVFIEEISSLFSYDSGSERISPDRQFSDHTALLQEIGALLSKCNEKKVCKEILKAAESNKNPFLEFEALNDLSFSFENHASWEESFYDLYGKLSVLASDDSMINSEAELLGYRTIRLTPYVKRFMMYNTGIKSADNIVQSDNTEYIWVSSGALDNKEREMLRWLKELGKDVGVTKPYDIRVFDHAILKETGMPLQSNSAVYVPPNAAANGSGKNIIGIQRDYLKDKIALADRYIHEAGHMETSAEDNTREHMLFVTHAFGVIAARQ